jgi:hypothetical protein
MVRGRRYRDGHHCRRNHAAHPRWGDAAHLSEIPRGEAGTMSGQSNDSEASAISGAALRMRRHRERRRDGLRCMTI